MLTLLSIVTFVTAIATLNRLRGSGKSPGLPNRWLIAALRAAQLDKVAAKVNPTGVFPHGHYVCPFFMGWAVHYFALTRGYSVADANHLFYAAWLGLTCWAVPAWGLYFAAATGIWREDETEIGFIDKIGLTLVPFVAESDTHGNRARGMICMALRGFVFALPMFIGFAWVLGPAALIEAPLFLLQGANYFAWAFKSDAGVNPIGYAEWSWGILIGVILTLVLI